MSSTFKEDKFPIVSLIGSIYVPRQASPEVSDGHGVVVQDPVSPNSPEPSPLVGQKGQD